MKIYIPDPTTLLGGQQSVTFPSSNKATEPLPGQPNRSRHFSKPPLSRLNSSASAADQPSVGIHPMDVSVEVAVERTPGDGSPAGNILAP